MVHLLMSLVGRMDNVRLDELFHHRDGKTTIREDQIQVIEKTQ